MRTWIREAVVVVTLGDLASKTLFGFVEGAKILVVDVQGGI
jgi:hypothetical protein